MIQTVRCDRYCCCYYSNCFIANAGTKLWLLLPQKQRAGFYRWPQISQFVGLDVKYLRVLWRQQSMTCDACNSSWKRRWSFSVLWQSNDIWPRLIVTAKHGVQKVWNGKCSFKLSETQRHRQDSTALLHSRKMLLANASLRFLQD